MVSKEQKIRIYRIMSFKYGIITLCYLIEEYAELENYEECQIILDAILQLGIKFSIELPTKFDENAFIWLKNELSNIDPNSNVDFYINATPYYAEKIKQEITNITD